MKNKGETKNLIMRQGDVLLAQIDAMPNDTTEIARTKRGVILADGKATGHAHRITARAAKLFVAKDGQRYLRAVETVKLVHEEHTAVEIPAGDFRVSIHAEYVAGDLPRRVED